MIPKGNPCFTSSWCWSSLWGFGYNSRNTLEIQEKPLMLTPLARVCLKLGGENSWKTKGIYYSICYYVIAHYVVTYHSMMYYVIAVMLLHCNAMFIYVYMYIYIYIHYGPHCATQQLCWPIMFVIIIVIIIISSSSSSSIHTYIYHQMLHYNLVALYFESDGIIHIIQHYIMGCMLHI